jgi:4-amino-4-deoxy-L-arabinose transferase-like glycosyltransferase
LKELITEEQANWIILGLSIAIALGGLGFGFFWSASLTSLERKAHWARALIVSVVGLAVWGFWNIYNSIENYYGLDSLKALGINFLISISLGVLFFALFALVPRWVSRSKAGSPGR